jgi:hypothetical protein
MHRLSASLIAILAALTAACSSSSSSGSDAGAQDAAADVYSACGHPGDMGNSLGIGKFCSSVADCAGTGIPTICATLGDPSEHFCTAMCTPADAAMPEGGTGFPTNCGEGATCECSTGGCGCTPNQCL